MRKHTTLLSLLLVSGALWAEDSAMALRQVQEQSEPVRVQLLSVRGMLGLDEKSDFKARSLTVDGQGDRHVRFQHYFNGVRVFGSESVVSTDSQGNRKGEAIHHLHRDIQLDVNPGLAKETVLRSIQTRLVPAGRLRNEPASELVVYPVTRQVRVKGAEGKREKDLNAFDVEDVVDRYVLAYYVQTRAEGPDGSLRFTDSIVDANTGEVIKEWNALQNADSKGTGKTLYSGTVTINTNSTGSTYELKDVSRATGPYFNVTPNGSSTVYTNANNVFGDGTTSNTQSAAADAMWGMQATYDAMLNCFNWKGVNNNNAGLNCKVHLNEDNAYFDGGNTLTFGDGISMFKPLVSTDVVGHEYGHAICQATSNLTYSGESGGLNEANSDMIGEMVEFYAANGKTGNVIPATGGDWVMGAKIGKTGNPLRYMYKPSKDGKSPDAWSSNIGNIDVHYSSGPANRMFYFLAQGSTASGDTSSSYLKFGPIQGIGIHKAGTIWMRAQTTKFTSSSKYTNVATYCKQAAEELYGVGSVEAKTVQRAFAAINVGSDIDIGTTALAIATHPSNQTVQAGSSVTFNVAATGGTTPYTYQWYRNGSAISGATSATYTFTAQATDSGNKYKAVVKDSASGSVTSNEATLTVSDTPSDLRITSQPQNQTVKANASASFSVAATGGVQPYRYQWYKNGSAISGATSATYSFTAQSSDNGSKFKAEVIDSQKRIVTSRVRGSVMSNEATLTVETTDPGTNLIVNGGFEQGATKWSGSTGSIGDWSSYNQPAYEGTKAAYLGGNGRQTTETLYQTVTIPARATSATLSFYLHIDTEETESVAYDKLAIQIRNTSGQLLSTLKTFSNVDSAQGYQLRTFDLSAYRGKTIRVQFTMSEDAYLKTNFLVDGVSLGSAKYK